MPTREILHTPVGEILSMADCFAISRGAELKPERRKWTYDEVMELR
ncbi:MAG: hypothetical protein ACLU9S_22290 [Oscillospiraceae bacterium]|nr:MAG TPA: hypothetical protein [Caudoviricetes sp.]